MKKRIEIDVRDQSGLYYGQKVYVVENHERVSFKEKCPVCGDTNEIEVKGYKFRCPLCADSGRRNGATEITVRDYMVFDYIIHKFDVIGEQTKGAYTGDALFNDRYLPRINWHGFTKCGNGYDGIRSRDFNEFDFREIDPDEVDLVCVTAKPCFYSKADANRFCKRLHERQKELLDKFNAEHGTNHAYPFEY